MILFVGFMMVELVDIGLRIGLELLFIFMMIIWVVLFIFFRI